MPNVEWVLEILLTTGEVVRINRSSPDERIVADEITKAVVEGRTVWNPDTQTRYPSRSIVWARRG
jgi:hypothetical protein